MRSSGVVRKSVKYKYIQINIQKYIFKKARKYFIYVLYQNVEWYSVMKIDGLILT